APSHCSALSKPVSVSIQSKLTPSGACILTPRVGNWLIKSAQTCKAPPEPVSGVALLSSRPNQTTARCSPLKPANQLSRRSLVVPGLPAGGEDAGNWL